MGQLVGVTAMMLASKYEEIYPPEVRTQPGSVSSCGPFVCDVRLVDSTPGRVRAHLCVRKRAWVDLPGVRGGCT